MTFVYTPIGALQGRDHQDSQEDLLASASVTKQKPSAWMSTAVRNWLLRGISCYFCWNLPCTSHKQIDPVLTYSPLAMLSCVEGNPKDQTRHSAPSAIMLINHRYSDVSSDQRCISSRDPPHPPHPGQPPGGWPAEWGELQLLHLLHGVRLFFQPRLSPPSAPLPWPSSTCAGSGDLRGEGRCLRLEPCLTLFLAGRLHGSFLTPGGIPSPSGSRSCLPVFVSFGAPSWDFFPICGSVPESNAVSLSPQRKWAGVSAFSMSWVMGTKMWREIPKTKQDTVYLSPSCFINHRYSDVSSDQKYISSRDPPQRVSRPRIKPKYEVSNCRQLSVSREAYAVICVL